MTQDGQPTIMAKRLEEIRRLIRLTNQPDQIKGGPVVSFFAFRFAQCKRPCLQWALLVAPPPLPQPKPRKTARFRADCGSGASIRCRFGAGQHLAQKWPEEIFAGIAFDPRKFCPTLDQDKGWGKDRR